MKKMVSLKIFLLFYVSWIILFSCKKESVGNYDALQNSTWKFTREDWYMNDGTTTSFLKEQSYLGIPSWFFSGNTDFKIMSPGNDLFAYGQWSKTNDELVIKLKYTPTDTFHINHYSIVELSDSTMKLDFKNQHAEASGNKRVTKIIYDFTRKK